MQPMVTVKNLVCVTYQANNSTLPYHFVAPTEEEAREQLSKWLDKGISDTPTEDENEPEVKEKSGRGQHFINKVWMINREEKKKIRVDASEVGRYYNMGYVKGGPRTAL